MPSDQEKKAEWVSQGDPSQDWGALGASHPRLSDLERCPADAEPQASLVCAGRAGRAPAARGTQAQRPRHGQLGVYPAWAQTHGRWGPGEHKTRETQGPGEHGSPGTWAQGDLGTRRDRSRGMWAQGRCFLFRSAWSLFSVMSLTPSFTSLCVFGSSII